MLPSAGSGGDCSGTREAPSNGTFCEPSAKARSSCGSSGTRSLHRARVSQRSAQSPSRRANSNNPRQTREVDLYGAWSNLTPRVACRTTFWANLTCRHIENGRIRAAYLAANGGGGAGGAERIDRVLHGKGESAAKPIDLCVRTVFSATGRLAGSPGQQVRLCRLPARSGVVARTLGGRSFQGRFRPSRRCSRGDASEPDLLGGTGGACRIRAILSWAPTRFGIHSFSAWLT